MPEVQKGQGREALALPLLWRPMLLSLLFSEGWRRGELWRLSPHSQALGTPVMSTKRFVVEAERILVALVNTELTILQSLKGEKEAELRALIWQARDCLKEKKRTRSVR